ncbi:MAG: preprotein translocase subunit SecY [Candidatus ainarchaeum sp.]|nr:preprotein translocase subunit SecY [Candidatus ainarchaeum sp.]
MIVDFLASISRSLPEVKAPTSPPQIKEKVIWTIAALVLFFVMYNVMIFGSENIESFDFLQMVTASRIGSLLTIGIGPIVLASIFLQLFVGAGIINLNMQDPNDKKKFHEAQKTLAILIALAEATIFVTTGVVKVSDHWGMTLPLLAIIQITFGSVALLYLDEVISKYGIGSGISIFIAAGVSFSVIGGLIGTIIFGDYGVVAALTEGGAEGIPKAILATLPFIFTILVFICVVYAESMKVEIPIAYERVRGLVPKLPLKLLYVSNIPVIFASALLMSVVRLSEPLSQAKFILGDVNIAHYLYGVLYMIRPIYGSGGAVEHFNYLLNGITPVFGLPEWLHAITYILFLSLASILFGIFWAETSNMDSKSVAKQLDNSGMQVPGYRRDPRMLEKVLEKHIFPLTVLGSFLVGLLAGIADLTGALGTGTGILLTVGILYRMYEQIKQMKVLDLYPSIGKLIS